VNDNLPSNQIMTAPTSIGGSGDGVTKIGTGLSGTRTGPDVIGTPTSTIDLGQYLFRRNGSGSLAI
jgi:hypothetical protein